MPFLASDITVIDVFIIFSIFYYNYYLISKIKSTFEKVDFITFVHLHIYLSQVGLRVAFAHLCIYIPPTGWRLTFDLDKDTFEVSLLV